MSHGRSETQAASGQMPSNSPRPRSPSADFQKMPEGPPRPPTPTMVPIASTSASASASAHSSADPASPLLPHAPAPPNRALSAMRTFSAVAAPLSDMGGAALSIADAANSTTHHPYVRGMLSGGLWAASGALSLVANSAASTTRQVVTDSLNIASGGLSMMATAASGYSDSQTAHNLTAAASYASNASWIAAGAGAMYQGWQTARAANASGWKKLSGGLQIVSGALNAGAGIMGIAATAVTEHSEQPNQPAPTSYTATALSLTSGALWAAGSLFGGASAWAGSGSAAAPAAAAAAPPVRQTHVTIQDP